MGEFVLVTGIGHCGTAWLARALSHPKSLIFADHELIKQTTGTRGTSRWKIGNRHGLANGIDGHFNQYFATIRKLLSTYSVVVDSHSWVPSLVPLVAEKIRIAGVIHLVRNGIQNVYSLYYSADLEKWFEVLIDQQLHFVDQPTVFETRWERYCAFWAANIRFATKIYADHIITLEELVTNVEILRNFITAIYPRAVVSRDQLREVQAQDINRHLTGRRDPDTLWKRLGPDQRLVFSRVCGPLMRELGYWK